LRKIYPKSNEESPNNTSSNFTGDDSPEIASSGDHGRSGLSLGLMGRSGFPLLDESSGFNGSLGSSIALPASPTRLPLSGLVSLSLRISSRSLPLTLLPCIYLTISLSVSDGRKKKTRGRKKKKSKRT
jgi:hypothetical protein